MSLGKNSKPVTSNRKYLYYIAFILLAFTALIALFIGYGAIYGHLQAPP